VDHFDRHAFGAATALKALNKPAQGCRPQMATLVNAGDTSDP
jgi:hypothetical protein